MAKRPKKFNQRGDFSDCPFMFISMIIFIEPFKKIGHAQSQRTSLKPAPLLRVDKLEKSKFLKFPRFAPLFDAVFPLMCISMIIDCRYHLDRRFDEVSRNIVETASASNSRYWPEMGLIIFL